jgi:hypothetical protein
VAASLTLTLLLRQRYESWGWNHNNWVTKVRFFVQFFRGNSLSSEFFGKTIFFRDIFFWGGGEFSAEFYSEFSAEKMYEKSATLRILWKSAQNVAKHFYASSLRHLCVI